ncbi:hypothetical protein LTR66_006648 [Elasticomyces elasticus]|nr:hypothetical protein LTR66_006648 [Elasticomyces elasticus]KAK4991002.1 hypothetical protein LTR50_002080 [Elasticomyces elasticus]
MISLSEQEAAKRFDVTKAIERFPSNLSDTEEQYVKTVLQYMDIAYSPKRNTGRSCVEQFCAPDNVFEARSTFPTAHDAQGYAESHSHVMASLPDLHIKSFQIVNVKENLVSLRYEATGSHTGEDHNGIKATGRRGNWSGSGNFVMDEKTGKIAHWWKDWDKMQMWKQLGWVRPNNDETEFA